MLYAASPSKDAAGWSRVHSEDHEKEILQTDERGVELPAKTVMINEAACLKEVIETGRCTNGLWIAGQKHTITRYIIDEEIAEQKCVCITTAVPGKKGAVIITTKTQIVVALFDESANIPGGNAKKCAVDFAQYMIEMGY